MIFVGTFEHTLDKKGRLVLPSKFRHQLETTTTFASPGFGQCVALWPEDSYSEYLNRIREQVRLGDTQQHKTLRLITSASSQLKPDTQGRVLLPENLLTWGNLQRDVVLVGTLDRIEIWDKETWEADSVDSTTELMEVLESGLGI